MKWTKKEAEILEETKDVSRVLLDCWEVAKARGLTKSYDAYVGKLRREKGRGGALSRGDDASPSPLPKEEVGAVEIAGNEESKVLFFDIETMYSKVAAWHLGEQRIFPDMVLEHGYLLCWAAKWRGYEEVKWDALVNYPMRYEKDRTDDSAVCHSMWALLDAADVVVAHNGDNFDVKKMNRFFLKNGINPPSPYHTIDTKKTTKATYGFDSNSLNALCQQMDIGAKIENGGIGLWKKIEAGDAEAWKLMVEYNKKDTGLLEEWYELSKSFVKSHPNVAAVDGMKRCRKCGSDQVAAGEVKWNRNKTGKYQHYSCLVCGDWQRGAENLATKDERDNILRQI